jgi:hypothetical protein
MQNKTTNAAAPAEIGFAKTTGFTYVAEVKFGAETTTAI